MDFIQISGCTIPTLRHNLEIGFVWKGCHMEFSVMGFEESARNNANGKEDKMVVVNEIRNLLTSQRETRLKRSMPMVNEFRLYTCNLKIFFVVASISYACPHLDILPSK